jgi:RNA-splicing ligase RtcB
MGCYESRILQEDSAKAAGPVTVEQAKEVVSFLRKAADLKSVRRNLIEEDFEEDPKADGDIAGLLRMADKKLKGELLKIRDDLLKKARELEITDDKRKASGTQRGLTRAFAEAFKAFKKAYRFR